MQMIVDFVSADDSPCWADMPETLIQPISLAMLVDVLTLDGVQCSSQLQCK